jgi:hypothetical protein
MSDPGEGTHLGFTDEHFPESSHVCLIYSSDAERQGIISDYLTAGLKRGERVRYFAEATTPEEVRSWLLDSGIDLAAAEAAGAFTVSDAVSAYCPSGHFDPRSMIDRMVQGYAQVRKAGFHGVRSCGEMTWVHKGIAGSERWLEYEALINTIASDFPHSGMCQYDARRFDGAAMFKVLQIHPYIIAQGQVVRNPYYLKPEEFMAAQSGPMLM